MAVVPTKFETVRRVATAVLVVDLIGSCGACGYGTYELVAGAGAPLGWGFVAGGLAGVLFGLLLYCQVLLLYKFVNYTFRAYEALLDAGDLLRRQGEHARTIAENSSLSEWAKRIVYREKDYEFLRDTIHDALVRQDWEAAEHLIRDVDTEFGYHEEAARFREGLETARKATTEERISAVLTRFDKLYDQQKWQKAHDDYERLKALFPDDPRIAALPREIELHRQEYKRNLLADYDQAIRNQDVDHAHRLLFALDQYLVPKEAQAIKASARGVFRAKLEQLKTQFSIAVSYKQFNSAIEAGQRLIHEFPNSGYAQEISKLMPVLRQRAREQKTADAATAPPSATS